MYRITKMVSPMSLRATCLVLGILILCNLVLAQGHDKWKKTITHRAFPEYKVEYKEPTICDKASKQPYSGYFVVNSTKNFFYWFFESKNKPQEDPIVLWVNGGPGCSSLNALFLEVGPYKLKKGGNDTIPNPYSWNNNASIIFLDQPTNTGYSYGDDVDNTSVAASDIYAFLQLFFHQFNNYTHLNFHIAGESYAGHFIPAVATEIVNKNNNASEDITYINLESVLIGNGVVEPVKQLESCPHMACNSTYKPVLTNDICHQMSEDFPKCASEIENCNKSPNVVNCVIATLDCYEAMIKPYTDNTNQSLFDIRRKCDGKNYCYSEADDLDIFANLENTKAELGVNTSLVFQACNNTGVFIDFGKSGDMVLQFDKFISQLLESKVRVLIYAGDADYLCNWYGVEAWVKELQWSGKEGFNNANVTQWMTKDPVKYVGDVRTFEGFTFLKIFEAGHMAPYDQPGPSLDFFNRWIYKEAL